MAKLNKASTSAPVGKSPIKVTDKRVRNFESLGQGWDLTYIERP